MEGTCNLLPVSAAQGPCPPDPYQAVQSTFDFEESTKILAEEQEPPSSPFGRLSFRKVLHNSFAIPEQWSQRGVRSLLYGLVHLGQAARSCLLG